MKLASRLTAALVLCIAPPLATAQERSDAEVLAAFDALAPAEQRGVADYLRLDLSHADRFQLTLTRYVLETSDRDPGFWPEASGPRWFDPQTHAPKQPIARKLLDVDSQEARRFSDVVARTIPARRMIPGFTYDWTSGDVVRLPRADDPRRLVENALRGFGPDLDLAEALILRFLDDGSQRETLNAFEHRYTDRTGNVFPSVSLYDAWGSGAEIEMPDVDVLGLVHTLLPEKKWSKRWVAPIPTSEHDRLYGMIEELFVPAKQYRSLREALARCYLIGIPVMRDGFGPTNVDVFHAFWEVQGSELAAAGSSLPKVGDDWTDFLSEWLRKLGKDKELVQKMLNRRQTLINDEAFVRGRLLAVMEDMGAFDRGQ